MNRRSFLKGVGVGIAAVVTAPLIRNVMPMPKRLVLWGDGIHDDQPALQALFDASVAGETHGVDIRDGATRVLPDGSVFIDRGTYLLKDTLRLSTEGHGVIIQNSTLERAGFYCAKKNQGGANLING